MIKKVMQLPVCAPKVEECMLKPEYWIEKIDDAEKLILSDQEIIKFNKKSFRKMKSKGFKEWLYDLKTYPEIITREELLHTMKTYSSEDGFTHKSCYDTHARKISETVRKEVLNQANFDGIPDEIRVEWGMLIKRENVRTFPTETLFAEEPKFIDFDLFQLTTLPTGSPVVILHQSKNGNWYYIQSIIYKGWIKRENIALAKNKKEVFDYVNSDKFLIVTGSKIETEPNPFIKQISNILFQMGDKIPLIEFDQIPESIPLNNLHAQSPQGCYVVKIPVKDKKGYLEFKLALVARSNDVCEGYLPYTRGNIIEQAFKLLGERYGWNGMFKRRDCAQLVMNIYQTMNIILPGYTRMQEEGAAGISVRFSGSIKRRESVLNKLQPGEIIHLKGHVVMYLGNAGKNHYIIHAGSGYGIKSEDGKTKPITVHGVFISEVHQLLMSGEKSYLEAFTTAQKLQ
ncbi:MAG TPA: glycoside hydrolase [Candidatus Atribacteria bacterium]|nr:glycoside hydrolase [Candidatus Atribacteria bacterium]